MLRRRTDSYAYDVDQLFLGTLLFTVSAFLFPTVLAYAALFAVVSTQVKRSLSELILRYGRGCGWSIGYWPWLSKG